MKKVCIVGAGPAGLIAGAFAAENGAAAEIFDKNERAGRKLYLTGKGRCNITNSADLDGFLKNTTHNGRFLFSAFGGFFSSDILAVLEREGVPVKLERGGRYFPASDKSSDVIRALVANTAHKGARLLLGTGVESIERDGNGFLVRSSGVHGGARHYDGVIIATGGMSYASTGSTGDGYRFAERFGHTVLPPKPSLIPFETVEDWPRELMGLSLKNVVLAAYKPEKRAEKAENVPKKEKKARPVYEELGEMLFTHFGVSGPLVLSASSFLADAPEGARLTVDLKPGLTPEQLDARLLRDFEKYKHKQVRNAMAELLPQRLIETVLALSEVPPEKPIDALTRGERGAVAKTLKCMELTVRRARPLDEAIITRGGVSVKEIDPRTMESKLVPGLFFAGELIDCDACTGGFNLQIAWSTGAAAGRAAAGRAE